MKMYRNFKGYDICLCLLKRLSSVEYLTLLLAIDETDSTPIHFIEQLFSEKYIYRCMPNLHQFHFHIRSIFKDVSPTITNDIFQSFLKRQQQQQSFDYFIDHFNNNYGQCQIYSLPFLGTRLDFVSNRFPFFDNNSTFSNVTLLLLFDDVEPFENVFFERIARVLPCLRTLEIINPLQQREKSAVTKTNIVFPHLTVLIFYENHMDYTELFLYEIHLPSLIELAINKDMLFTLIDQYQQRTSDNCSRLRIIHTSKPSYESRDTIRKFFPQVDYIDHVKDRK